VVYKPISWIKEWASSASPENSFGRLTLISLIAGAAIASFGRLIGCGVGVGGGREAGPCTGDLGSGFGILWVLCGVAVLASRFLSLSLMGLVVSPRLKLPLLSSVSYCSVSVSESGSG